jgi:hypothetical protein
MCQRSCKKPAVVVYLENQLKSELSSSFVEKVRSVFLGLLSVSCLRDDDDDLLDAWPRMEEAPRSQGRLLTRETVPTIQQQQQSSICRLPSLSLKNCFATHEDDKNDQPTGYNFRPLIVLSCFNGDVTRMEQEL